jgi:hypothetical protein
MKYSGYYITSFALLFCLLSVLPRNNKLQNATLSPELRLSSFEHHLLQKKTTVSKYRLEKAKKLRVRGRHTDVKFDFCVFNNCCIVIRPVNQSLSAFIVQKVKAVDCFHFSLRGPPITS